MLAWAAMPEANWATTRPARKTDENRSPPMVLAISKAAESGSSKVLPGCASWVAQATATKMPPPIRAISTMARGMVRFGSMVSSVSVVTASKPRKE
ncbi:hypothetical protein GCM10020295_01360 [Streptomyces cinereospinus]